MDPAAMTALIESFQQAMAKSNQGLVQAIQSGTAQPASTPTSTTTTSSGTHQATTNDMMGAVALTGIKVPFSMGDSDEERLINFHEWKEEVNDKLDVA